MNEGNSDAGSNFQLPEKRANNARLWLLFLWGGIFFFLSWTSSPTLKTHHKTRNNKIYACFCTKHLILLANVTTRCSLQQHVLAACSAINAALSLVYVCWHVVRAVSALQFAVKKQKTKKKWRFKKWSLLSVGAKRQRTIWDNTTHSSKICALHNCVKSLKAAGLCSIVGPAGVSRHRGSWPYCIIAVFPMRETINLAYKHSGLKYRFFFFSLPKSHTHAGNISSSL